MKNLKEIKNIRIYIGIVIIAIFLAGFFFAPIFTACYECPVTVQCIQARSCSTYTGFQAFIQGKYFQSYK